MKVLVVSEMFRSLQGEGPNAGRPTTFLRLMGCNLRCSWCDTPYTWDGSRFDLRAEGRPWQPVDLARELDRLNGDRGLLDVTGGEPLLQQRVLADVLMLLRSRATVEVETNGTLAPLLDLQREVRRFNVSPKLAGAGNGPERHDLEILRQYAYLATHYDQALFKFVLTDPAELPEAERLVGALGVEGRHVWLMPQGRTPADMAERLPWVAEAALARGWSCSGRLHVDAFADARGR